jgi:hypothetical protein
MIFQVEHLKKTAVFNNSARFDHFNNPMAAKMFIFLNFKNVNSSEKFCCIFFSKNSKWRITQNGDFFYNFF